MMNTTRFGNVQAAAVLAAMGLLAAAAPAVQAGSVTATWNFTTGSNATLGTSQVFNSVNAPNSVNPIGVTAYGFNGQAQITTTTTDAAGGGDNDVTNSQVTSQSVTPFDLYSKYNGAGNDETGLGLADGGGNFDEIDNIITNSSSNGNEDPTITSTHNTYFIQIDMTPLLTAVGSSGLSDTISLIIGSVTPPDGWEVSASATQGALGTAIQSGGEGSNAFAYPNAIALSTFSTNKYLTISATEAGSSGSNSISSVLLDSMSLQFTPGNPTQPAGPSTPVPASAGLLAVGGLALVPMLFRRRKMTI